MRVTVGRVAVVVTVLVIAGFWIWVFSGAPRKKNPDYLADRAFAERTQQRCERTDQSLRSLPRAEDARSATERADVVDRATDDLQAMVDRIAADQADNPSDDRIVDLWLDDWRIYLQNRREYATALRRDETARFLVDEKPRANDSYDLVIENFADINDIPECAPPLDVS